MARQIEAGKPGAQCWVGLDGTWHLVAAGKVFHTGEVREGKQGNSRSLGFETDHTINETWSGVHLLDSLRRGTAAILRHLEADQRIVEFHKTICSPPGRKSDPDGLDLAVERHEVAALLTAPPEMLMRTEVIIKVPAPQDGRQLVHTDRDGKPLGRWSVTSSAQVCASAKGDVTNLLVQPTRFDDALVLAVATLDGSPAPTGAEARVLIEHR